MVETTRIAWRPLLGRAAALYDDPATGLAEAARGAGRHGFRSGADWMRRAMEVIRDSAIAPTAVDFHLLGWLKYGAATGLALSWVAATILVGWPLFAPLAALLFYAAEAQGVFLFPVAIDGDARPFRTARRWTGRAGGTLRVMAVVMPIAATMLLGGCAGRGFRRSWCLGCLAVVVWYERLRASSACR